MRRKEKLKSFLYYFVISTSIILFLFILQKKLDSMEEIHSLYSRNTVEIKMSHIDAIQVIEESEELHVKGMKLVSEGLHPFLELKGIYFDEKLCDIPIIQGRFLTSIESRGEEDKVVVGYQYQDDIYKKNNQKYYIIDGEEYEVVGIIGEQYGSRYNTMIFLPFKTAAEKYGISGVYLLDETKEILTSKLLKNATNSQQGISVRKLYPSYLLEFLKEMKEDNGMFVLYFLIMLLIILCSFLGTNYCMQINLSDIKTYKILGIPNVNIIIIYMKRYIAILFYAFVSGIIFGVTLKNILEIHLVNYDYIYVGLVVFFVIVNIEFLLKIVISVKRINIEEWK